MFCEIEFTEKELKRIKDVFLIDVNPVGDSPDESIVKKVMDGLVHINEVRKSRKQEKEWIEKRALRALKLGNWD